MLVKTKQSKAKYATLPQTPKGNEKKKATEFDYVKQFKIFLCNVELHRQHLGDSLEGNISNIDTYLVYIRSLCRCKMISHYDFDLQSNQKEET